MDDLRIFGSMLVILSLMSIGLLPTFLVLVLFFVAFVFTFVPLPDSLRRRIERY